MSNSPSGLMKAWRLTEPGGALQLCEIARPRAHDDWAVVDVRAAGLCHTDVGLLSGELTGLIRQWPITLGHEISGVLTEVVDPACPIPVGTSVGIAGLSGNTPGVHFDGGYAEQILIPWRNLVPVPAGIPASVAAVATDAGATAYNAVHVSAGIQRGDQVGVVGLGGLGMLAARIAVVAGADVFGVDVEASTFVRARNIGVTECFETIAPLEALKLDCILDFAGFGTTTAESIEALPRGGRLVQVGLGARAATISTAQLVTKQITLIGSATCLVSNLAGVYELIVSGQLEPEVVEVGFLQIPDRLSNFASAASGGHRIVAVPL